VVGATSSEGFLSSRILAFHRQLGVFSMLKCCCCNCRDVVTVPSVMVLSTTISVSVCLSVFPLTYLKNHMFELNEIFWRQCNSATFEVCDCLVLDNDNDDDDVATFWILCRLHDDNYCVISCRCNGVNRLHRFVSIRQVRSTIHVLYKAQMYSITYNFDSN